MPGQMYMASNRVTSLAGLFLIGNYTKAVLKVNNAATKEHDRLRAEQAVSFYQLNETVLPEKMVISILNVRSLKKHFDDIGNTSPLVQTNTLCFTENQLLPSQGGLDLPAAMGGFYVTYNPSDDRFCGLILCYRDRLHLLNHAKMNGFSILTSCKPSISNECFKIILLFKKNSVPQAFFS